MSRLYVESFLVENQGCCLFCCHFPLSETERFVWCCSAVAMFICKLFSHFLPIDANWSESGIKQNNYLASMKQQLVVGSSIPWHSPATAETTNEQLWPLSVHSLHFFFLPSSCQLNLSFPYCLCFVCIGLIYAEMGKITVSFFPPGSLVCGTKAVVTVEGTDMLHKLPLSPLLVDSQAGEDGWGSECFWIWQWIYKLLVWTPA